MGCGFANSCANAKTQGFLRQLAKRVGTSQQQIARLESPSYEGHSLRMLRRVAEVLGASVKVKIYRQKEPKTRAAAEGASKIQDETLISLCILLILPGRLILSNYKGNS